MMEVDEGGSGQTSSVDLDWELDGDVWHSGNQAREGNRSCPRKKEKIEIETSRKIFNLQIFKWGETFIFRN